MNPELARRIDALLPQTQCTRCGFEGCRPYAEAIAEGRADIDQCPPGGDAGVAKLAALLGRAAKPLNAQFGAFAPPRVAVIDEAACIGCTKCIQACPVDAIVGASKLMHTVIASWCTGCELCIPPCPVDCIVLEPAPALPEASLSRERHRRRGERLAREERERAERLAAYE
jgi:Na+-translocating ferredoxin:NAD+ oxidoreductase subunit B